MSGNEENPGSIQKKVFEEIEKRKKRARNVLIPYVMQIVEDTYYLKGRRTNIGRIKIDRFIIEICQDVGTDTYTHEHFYTPNGRYKVYFKKSLFRMELVLDFDSDEVYRYIPAHEEANVVIGWERLLGSAKVETEKKVMRRLYFMEEQRKQDARLLTKKRNKELMENFGIEE